MCLARQNGVQHWRRVLGPTKVRYEYLYFVAKINFNTYFSFSVMLEKKLRIPFEPFLEIQKMIPEMLAMVAIRQPVLNVKLK